VKVPARAAANRATLKRSMCDERTCIWRIVAIMATHTCHSSAGE
jgi:hypothetical protein